MRISDWSSDVCSSDLYFLPPAVNQAIAVSAERLGRCPDSAKRAIVKGPLGNLGAISGKALEEDPGGMDLKAQRSFPGRALSRRQFVATAAVGIAAFTATLLPGFALAAQPPAPPALPSPPRPALPSPHTGAGGQATNP